MTFTELERVGYRAPLALRCVDQVTGRPVGDGLEAAAVRDGDNGTPVPARRSLRSELLGFGSLPGLAAWQRSRSAGGAPLPWADTPPPVPVVVTVRDRRDRFLPVTVRIDAPQDAPVDVPLFSAATRPTPSGWATVRGEARRAGTPTPATWCVVEVSAGGVSYRAVCDAAGRYVLHLPYPEALPALPEPSDQPVPAALTWPLTVSARYEPGRLTGPPGSVVPYQDTVLGQASALIQGEAGPRPTVTATLAFGVIHVLPLAVVPA